MTLRTWPLGGTLQSVRQRLKFKANYVEVRLWINTLVGDWEVKWKWMEFPLNEDHSERALYFQDWNYASYINCFISEPFLLVQSHLLAESVSGLMRDRSCPETAWQFALGRRRRRRRRERRTILAILRCGAEWIVWKFDQHLISANSWIIYCHNVSAVSANLNYHYVIIIVNHNFNYDASYSDIGIDYKI